MSNVNNGETSGYSPNKLAREPEQRLAISDASRAGAEALAKATITTRYELAQLRPRVIDQVRTEILELCEVPAFAKAARYKLPFGEDVEGWSIRFVEAALQCMGNIDSQVVTVYDDEEKRVIRVTVSDLQKNTHFTGESVVEKRIERKKLRRGQVALGKRVNTSNEEVFIVAATERDVAQKTNSEASKMIRTQGQRHIPRWILDDALAVATKAMLSGIDPMAERKALVDGFAELGVKAGQLEAFLGHELGGASPAELLDLRAVYTAIRDGAQKWTDYAELSKAPQPVAGEDDPHAAARAELTKRREAIKAKQERKAGGGQAQASKPPTKAEAAAKNTAPPATKSEPKPEPAKPAEPAKAPEQKPQDDVERSPTGEPVPPAEPKERQPGEDDE